MLIINTSKTKCILFGRKDVNKVENLQKVYLGQMEVEVVNHYRYLGVILDSNMTFHQHIGNVFKLVAHKRMSKIATSGEHVKITPICTGTKINVPQERSLKKFGFQKEIPTRICTTNESKNKKVRCPSSKDGNT